jgi:hypothetical protein
VPVGAEQHDAGTQHQALLGAPGPDEAGKLSAVFIAQLDLIRGWSSTSRSSANWEYHQPRQPHPSHGARWSATHRSGTITTMPAPPAPTKTSLQQRLSARARERWPQLSSVDVRSRGAFAYVTGHLPDYDPLPLMRLRYGGSAARWGFAIYLASKDGYEDSILPTGDLAGTPEDALDCACGLYLGDPTAWI